MDEPFVLGKAEGRRQLATAESRPDADRHVMPRDAPDERPAEKRECQRQPTAPWLGEDEHTKFPEHASEHLKLTGTEVVKDQVPHGDAPLLCAERLENIATQPSDPMVQPRRNGSKIQSGDGAAGKTGGKVIAQDSLAGSQLDDPRPSGCRMRSHFAENPSRSAQKAVESPQIVPASDRIRIERVERIEEFGNERAHKGSPRPPRRQDFNQGSPAIRGASTSRIPALLRA